MKNLISFYDPDTLLEFLILVINMTIAYSYRLVDSGDDGEATYLSCTDAITPGPAVYI